MYLNEEDIFLGLDKTQKEVVKTLKGPLRVMAGAGSGKTLAMTRRIAYGIYKKAYKAENILAITFTKKAAGELNERLIKFGIHGVRACTFHSEAYRQLQLYFPLVCGSAMPRLIKSKNALIYKALEKCGIKDADNNIVQDISAKIAFSKTQNLTIQDYIESLDEAALSFSAGSLNKNTFAAILNTYESLKTKDYKIDFEDLLSLCLGMLQQNASVSSEISNLYQHFVVDEYQDLSPLQHSLLKIWSKYTRDIAVVGDISQTIYSFAGADSLYLKTFDKEFYNSTTIYMQNNYRSTKEIISLANNIVEGDKGSVILKTDKAGAKLTLKCLNNPKDEAGYIALKIKELHENGVAYKDIAILIRLNAQEEPLGQALKQYLIPYEFKTYQENAFNSEESRTKKIDNCVTISTIHSAKGLEWKYVFLAGANDMIIPSSSAIATKKVHDEKLLFYVAVTRAKDYLHISYVNFNKSKAMKPSRFLAYLKS